MHKLLSGHFHSNYRCLTAAGIHWLGICRLTQPAILVVDSELKSGVLRSSLFFCDSGANEKHDKDYPLYFVFFVVKNIFLKFYFLIMIEDELMYALRTGILWKTNK